MVPTVICLDLEGVLIPEMWLGVADRVDLDELRVTTREIGDYDQLMRHRLGVLEREGIDLATIQDVINGMDIIPGAREFLDDLRERYQVVILSDTFYEFAHPFMRKLGWPTLFCHSLEVADGRISDYRLRMPDPKRSAVKAFHGLNFHVIAAGDSYNDTTMLSEADAGVFMRPPDNVVADFPQFLVAREFDELRTLIDDAAALAR